MTLTFSLTVLLTTATAAIGFVINQSMGYLVIVNYFHNIFRFIRFIVATFGTYYQL